MTCIEIYKHCVQVTYRSTICSKATFFILFTYAVGIILSFVLAYESGGLWLKQTVFYEQPDIRYKYQYIFNGQTDRLTSEVFCSNMLEIRNKEKHNSCLSVKVREIDENLDGKYDKMEFNLKAQNPYNSVFNSIMLILMLDYKVHNVCPLHFQTPIILQHTHIGAGRILEVKGDVLLFQPQTIPCNSEMFFVSDDQDFSEIQDLVENHQINNISIQIGNQFTLWKPSEHSVFELKLLLKYPEQGIRYKPTTLQILKYAWIHYLAISIPVSWILNKIRNYVFTSRLVTYRKKIKEKLD